MSDTERQRHHGAQDEETPLDGPPKIGLSAAASARDAACVSRRALADAALMLQGPRSRRAGPGAKRQCRARWSRPIYIHCQVPSAPMRPRQRGDPDGGAQRRTEVERRQFFI